MTRVLFIGQHPEPVDFTDPMVPPGMDAERNDAGMALALKQMAGPRWHADPVLTRPDGTARLRRGAEPQGPNLRLRGDRRWHSSTAPQPADLRDHDQCGAQSRAGRHYRVQPRPEDSADATARWLKAD